MVRSWNKRKRRLGSWHMSVYTTDTDCKRTLIITLINCLTAYLSAPNKIFCRQCSRWPRKKLPPPQNSLQQRIQNEEFLCRWAHVLKSECIQYHFLIFFLRFTYSAPKKTSYISSWGLLDTHLEVWAVPLDLILPSRPYCSVLLCKNDQIAYILHRYPGMRKSIS